MINVIPFIQTNCSEKYKAFLATLFSIDMLYPVFNENSCKTLFNGWKGKNMINWYKFINDDKIILEFYLDNYKIKNIGDNITYQMSLPKTINEFINDMDRFGIQLYWYEQIINILEPKDFMNKNEVSGYYTNLLGSIGKSHELS
jgi:hypothetical protein